MPCARRSSKPIRRSKRRPSIRINMRRVSSRRSLPTATSAWSRRCRKSTVTSTIASSARRTCPRCDDSSVAIRRGICENSSSRTHPISSFARTRFRAASCRNTNGNSIRRCPSSVSSPISSCIRFGSTRTSMRMRWRRPKCERPSSRGACAKIASCSPAFRSIRASVRRDRTSMHCARDWDFHAIVPSS